MYRCDPSAGSARIAQGERCPFCCSLATLERTKSRQRCPGAFTAILIINRIFLDNPRPRTMFPLSGRNPTRRILFFGVPAMAKNHVSGHNIVKSTGRRFCEECGQECRINRADTWRAAGKVCPACGSRRLSVDYVPGKRNSKAPTATKAPSYSAHCMRCDLPFNGEDCPRCDKRAEHWILAYEDYAWIPVLVRVPPTDQISWHNYEDAKRAARSLNVNS